MLKGQSSVGKLKPRNTTDQFTNNTSIWVSDIYRNTFSKRIRKVFMYVCVCMCVCVCLTFKANCIHPKKACVKGI